MTRDQLKLEFNNLVSKLDKLLADLKSVEN